MLAYPNYDKSLISIISSIKGYYRTPYVYPTAPMLDNELRKGYKNIVLIVLSGMGTEMLERNLSRNDFFKKNMKCSLSSVYPSSTASSSASYYTGVSPNEHAWLGQSMFFKEFCRTIDVMTNFDSYTKQPVSKLKITDYVIPYETIFDDIKKSIIGNVQPFTISSPSVYIPENGCIRKTAEDFDRVCELISMICSTEQNTFTYVQWNSPEDIARKDGCYSEETKLALKSVEKKLQTLSKSVSDTLFIVSADHGMTDISEEVVLNQLYDVMDCLIMPPSVEGRGASFFVKSDRRTDFERYFFQELSEHFMLISRYDVFNKGIFGNGKTHTKVFDFVGDYFSCAISDKTLRYKSPLERMRPAYKADHGGLTEQEMFIPLIIAPTKLTKKSKIGYTENIMPD